MLEATINTDCGESFGPWTIGADEELFDIVDIANLACGFHGGDPDVMAKTVQLAKKYGVGIGAHPGYNGKLSFSPRRPLYSPCRLRPALGVFFFPFLCFS